MVQGKKSMGEIERGSVIRGLEVERERGVKGVEVKKKGIFRILGVSGERKE